MIDWVEGKIAVSSSKSGEFNLKSTSPVFD